MEIERRFLLKTFPKQLLSNSKSEEFVSAYVERKSGYKIRARKIGNKFFLTEKKGTGLAREEIEKEISKEEFTELSANALEIVKKRRYFVPYENLKLEIDIYEDSVKYPATVEVEFESKEQALRFVPLDWFGEEMGD